ELPPPLVTGEDDHAADLHAPEVTLELVPGVVEALHGRRAVDVALHAAEVDLPPGLPGGGLDLAQVLLTAKRLHGLVEDGVPFFVVRPGRGAEARPEAATSTAPMSRLMR